MNLLSFHATQQNSSQNMFIFDNRYIIREVAVPTKSVGLPKWLMLSECFTSFLPGGCKTVAVFPEVIVLPLTLVSLMGKWTFTLNFCCWKTYSAFKNYEDNNNEVEKYLFSRYLCFAKPHNLSLTFLLFLCSLITMRISDAPLSHPFNLIRLYAFTEDLLVWILLVKTFAEKIWEGDSNPEVNPRNLSTAGMNATSV